MDKDESVRFAKKYLEDILSFFGLNIDVTVTTDGEVIDLRIPSSHLNAFLIGQHGDTLRSLQMLLSTTLRNRDAELHRINVDVADYKKHRADRLAEQVGEWVEKVRAGGEPYKLQPMNPADRRVVHNTVSDFSDIQTRSEGEGRDRHVVIEPA